MKSEKEIRSHRDDLKKCMESRLEQCQCHQCVLFASLQSRAVIALSWALDECPELDAQVEISAALARSGVTPHA